MPVPLPLRQELRLQLSLDDLSHRLGARTKLVILNSPDNPTGGVVRPRTPDAADMILASPAWVLSDEVYRADHLRGDVRLDRERARDARPDRLLDGLSKTYSMTGWRCGYAAVPEPLVDPLTRLITNSVFVRSPRSSRPPASRRSRARRTA